MPKYEDMTVPQLERKKAELMEKRVVLKAEVKEILVVLAEKIDEVKVRAKLDAMTGKERKIAAQVISETGAIKSEEKVGTPGAE